MFWQLLYITEVNLYWTKVLCFKGTENDSQCLQYLGKKFPNDNVERLLSAFSVHCKGVSM